MNIFLILCCITTIIQTRADCVWKLRGDLPENDPIYMKAGKAELIVPGPSGLTLKNGESMKLACPGNYNNYIKDTTRRAIIATCTAENKLLYDSHEFSLNGLECTYSAFSTINLLTKIPCSGGRGVTYVIGFNSTAKFGNEIAPLYKICYNLDIEAALYSEHELHGEVSSNPFPSENRTSFRKDGLSNPQKINYERKKQNEIFASLLGSDKYINNRVFLARGQLAPYADFIFNTWKEASMYLVNVAPQWQSINNGNWRKIESLVRIVANQKNQKLKIYTGIHGVLQLPDYKGAMVNIYLTEDENLPVPKYFWKIVQSELRGEAIALITLNNPYMETVNSADIFCTDICHSTNWNWSYREEIWLGYTFCCAANDFLNVVNIIPRLPDETRNMQGPVNQTRTS